MTVLKFEVLKLNCEPTEFSFVSNSWQCILRLICYATCMQPNCTNITDTGVFHEIIINVMFVRLQKTFSFLNTRSREASTPCCYASVARDLFTHISSEQTYFSKKRIRFIIGFLKIIQKKTSYYRSTLHLRSILN